MRFPITALFLLSLCGPALAADIGGTIQVELGTFHNSDSAWNLFSDNNAMPTRGLRGGFTLGENVAILGGWHRTNRGLEIEMPLGDASEGHTTRFQSAYTGDMLSLGAQGGLLMADVIYPYISVEGLFLRGVMRFDEDATTKNNIGQVVGAGASPGLATMAGIEARSPTGAVGIQVRFFAEAGRSWFATGNYGDLGQMTPGGFTVRGGAGLLF